MDKKNLLIAGGLIGGLFICLFLVLLLISANLILVSEMLDPTEYNVENASFNNSTPELTAVSIARLNFGVFFNEFIVDDVYLTDDGKYWNVDMHTYGKDPYVHITIDAKTLMSTGYEEGVWRSLDELKASYIADIQTNGPGSFGSNGKPQKITMGGKEIWKVSTQYIDDEDGQEHVAYVYVDLATGKSKNTLPSFNRAAGTRGWLTLKEVDDVINRGNKGDYQSNYLVDLGPGPFRDVLRDIYPE